MAQTPITGVTARAYKIPTEGPEGDGTFTWNMTTLVVVEVTANGQTGVGYSYTHQAATALIEGLLGDVATGRDAMDIEAIWDAMRWHLRNIGTSGLAACAVSSVDTALWDLKARLLGVPLASLFGKVREQVAVYGSGGFTTYDHDRLTRQIEGWRADGVDMAKIKIGAQPDEDVARVRTARAALGAGQLFVDANGAYSVRQALEFADAFREEDVRWFEEPVTSDNIAGLAQLVAQAPPGMDIAAGEYSFTIFDSRRLLEAQAVDVLQLDATRCAGYTGFLQAAALAQAANIPISSHCAPALHLPVAAHAPGLRHMEYFYDHVRIERELFDGLPPVENGCLKPNVQDPGHGLTFKWKDAERYAI